MIETYITNLKAERHKAWEAQRDTILRAFSTDANGNTVARELTADEQTKLAKTDAALDDYDAQIRTFEAQLTAQRAGNEARIGFEQFVRPGDNGNVHARFGEAQFRAWVEGTGPRVMELDFGKAIRREVDRRGVVNFRAIHADGTESRDLLVGTNTAGGYTVPRDFIQSVYMKLVQASSIYALGVQIIPTPHGRPIDYPKAASYGTATITGEGSAIAENDPTFTTLTLGSWKYSRVLQISNEMLTDTDVDLQNFVAEEAAIALSNAIGPDFITGNGTNKPTGIFSSTFGTGVTGQTGSTGIPSYGNLVDCTYALGRPYRENGAQWLWKDSSLAGIRKIVDTTGQPIWQPSMQAGEPDTLLGHPVVTDPNVTAAGTGIISGAFGDWSRAYVLRQSPLRMEMSPDYAFVNDLMTYKVVQRLDGKPNDQAAAVVYKGGAS